MRKTFFFSVGFFLIFAGAVANAQLLPNATLNSQSVQRWMQTNRDIAPIMQAIDTMNNTDAKIKAFDTLPAIEQDKKIDALLAAKNL